MAASFPRRVVQRIRRQAGVPPQHDMLGHPGEQYYFEQYMARLGALFATKQRVLDLGCQYGRFVVPLDAAGHDVVATDIDPICIASIRERCPGVEARIESITESCDRLEAGSFDVVLALELLYVLPDWEALLPRLTSLLQPGGRLVTSHRPIGYYVYRLSHEGRYDELDQLLVGTHPQLNAQSAESLAPTYQRAGLTINSLTPIGSFSGTEVDPFAALNDPARISEATRSHLMDLERRDDLTRHFLDSARYLLVVATADEPPASTA